MSTGKKGGEEQSPVTYVTSRSALLSRVRRGHDARGKIICVIADTGMGKSALMETVLKDEATMGAHVMRVSLAQADDPALRISRAARRLAALAEKERCVVGIVCPPPPDLSDVRREVMAIKKMSSVGALVVLTLLPESRDLADALLDATVVESGDLVGEEWRRIRGLENAHEVWRMTHGLPALVGPYLGEDGLDLWESLRMPGGYLHELDRILRDQVRDTLPEEERNLRLAMLLIGQGTCEDLALAVGRPAEDELEDIGRDAPLFGIDMVGMTFEVAGLANDEVLLSLSRTLSALCSARTALANDVASVLVRKGRILRAARVCRMGGDQRAFGRLCASGATSLVCHGAADLVREALEGYGEVDGAGDDADLVLGRQAILELVAPYGEAQAARGLCEELGPLDRRQELSAQVDRALASSRDVWAGRAPAELREVGTLSQQARLIGLHATVGRLLVAGRTSEAYALLVNEPARMRSQGLGEALACCDCRLCGALLGEAAPPEEQAAFEEGVRYLGRSYPTRLGRYASALPAVIGVLAGRARMVEGIERLVSLAERSGDSAVQAVLLVVAAIADARTHAHARAHVRAASACALAEGLGLTYLATAARLVRMTTFAALGSREEVGAFGEADGEVGALVDLARMADSIARTGGAQDVRLDVLVREACPYDQLWALNYLANDCGAISEAFTRDAPPAWTWRMPATLDADGAEQAGTAGGASVAAQDDLRTQGEARARVSLCGGLSVTVDGVAVDQRTLGHRRVSDLLSLLAAAPRHELARHEIIHALWGEDYLMGQQRLYEATAAARKVLGGARTGLDPLIVVRGGGREALNTSVVSCDVDDLRREIELVMSGVGGSLAVADHAAAARRIWGSGIPGELSEVSGAYRGAVAELEVAYANALVVASDAARRAGRRSAAETFARDALALDTCRDDARACLVMALAEQGRADEVARIAAAYDRRVDGGSAASPVLERALWEARDGVRGARDGR